MDATDTVPYEPTPQALEDSRDIIISAPSGKPQVCRCKTLELGDASASPDVCTCAVSRMSGDQPSTAETADIGGSKEAAASDAKPEVGGSQAAPGAPVTSMAAAPLDPTKHQPAHESNGDDKPRVEAAQEDVNSILQPQSNKTEEVLEEPPKEPTDEAIPIAPPDVEPSAPAATNAPEQEVDPVPEVAPAEEPEAPSPNKAPLDADDERRYLELQDAAEMHAAKARLDAQEGIVNEAEGALKEDARSPKPVDKNLKVNGYVLPKEWLQLPYITPQEQTTADGSEAKKRGGSQKQSRSLALRNQPEDAAARAQNLLAGRLPRCRRRLRPRQSLHVRGRSGRKTPLWPIGGTSRMMWSMKSSVRMQAAHGSADRAGAKMRTARVGSLLGLRRKAGATGVVLP